VLEGVDPSAIRFVGEDRCSEVGDGEERRGLPVTGCAPSQIGVRVCRWGVRL
jgi:hypothetical protein